MTITATTKLGRQQPASKRSVRWAPVNNSSPQQLAAGLIAGLWLLGAGATTDGIQLTRVLDTRTTPAVLHPAYPLDTYGWSSWHQLPPGALQLPATTRPPPHAGPEEAPVLFTRNNDSWLLNAGIDGRAVRLGRVFDRHANTVSASYNLNSLLTGSWTAFDTDPDLILTWANEANWLDLQTQPPDLSPTKTAGPPSAELRATLKDRDAKRRSPSA